MSSKNILASRLASLKAKTADLEVKEVKVPENSADILTLFEANSAARADSANQWTIDVFPNLIPILMFIMMKSLEQAGLTDHRNHAKSSVATICLYNTSLLYGFFLLNDMYIRPAPSAHARSWLQNTIKRDFAEFLLSLPVPDSFHTIFNQLHASESERTRNVFFVPSAAGFAHEHFFGKFLPLTFFSAIHDCTATMPGNSSRLDVLKDLFARPLYTIDVQNPAYQFISLIGDIIGVTQDQTTGTTFNYCNTKLYQVFTAVFNPVLFRDFQRRSTLASLNMKSPKFNTTHPNAYDVLFGYSSANIRELKVVLQAVSSILTGHVTMSKNLGQIITSASGNQILKHGYSEFALPTWSSNVNTTIAHIRAMTTYTLVSEEDRATDISFLTAPAARPAATNDVVDTQYVDTSAGNAPVALPPNRGLLRHLPWNRRQNADGANAWPSLTRDVVLFQDERNTTPRVLVLDIDNEKTTAAHLVTLTGKVIESFEIDGTTLEHPHPLKSLGMQNSLFADSAIPYRFVLRATKFYPRAAGSVLPPLARAKPNSQPRLPAASLLYNRLQMMIPTMRARTIDNLAVQQALPGLHNINEVDWLRYTQQFVGFRTVDGSSNDNANDNVINMEQGRLHVFSPYTYTPYEDDDEPLPLLSESRSYFLTNLRSFFGTDCNLVEVKHAYEAMPVV